MLAPFWTDLDGTGAPGIFAEILTDGVGTWLVIEHRVNVFGTTRPAGLPGLDRSQRDAGHHLRLRVPSQADPNGQPFLMGAENELGQGDMVAVLPTTDQRVTSTNPSPGESVSYSLTVRGTAKGTGTVTTEMDATGVPGTTIVRSPVQIR